MIASHVARDMDRLIRELEKMGYRAETAVALTKAFFMGGYSK